MDRKFTLDHLFLYHYNELNLTDSLAIELLIENDETFRIENEKIIEMKTYLDSDKKMPSPSSIDIIMNYDRASSSELAY